MKRTILPNTINAATQAALDAKETIGGFDWAGHQLASGQSTIPRGMATANVSMTSGQMRLAYFTSAKAETVNNVRVLGSGTAAGATPTLVRFGLFTVAGNGNLTLVASTANDTTVFASTNTAYTRALTAGYAMTLGQRYAIGVLIVTAAATPTLVGISASGPGTEFGLSPRACGFLNSQSDLPSSVTSGITDTTSWIYAAVTP